MTAITFGVLIIILCVAASVLGLLLIRKRFSAEELERNHEVAGVMLAVLGTLYAVLLGLVVVDAMNRYDRAKSVEATEANAIAGVMHLARTLPVERRIPFMRACLNYTDMVVNEEWDLLGTDLVPTPSGRKCLDKLWVTIAGFEPADGREQNLHAAMLTSMQQISDSRRERIVTSREGIPPLLWVVLILGGVFTVAFTYCFAMSNVKVQAVMTAVVATTLAMNVLLVVFFGAPYQGYMKIEPAAFQHILNLLHSLPVLQPGFNPKKDDANKHPKDSAPAPETSE